VPEFLLFMAITLSSVIFVFGGMISNVSPRAEQLSSRKVVWCYLLGISVAIYLAIINGKFLEYF
jgi:hypothetical protein